MTNVLVTGANGFVGQNLVQRLASHTACRVFAGLRKPVASLAVPSRILGDLTDPACLISAVAQIQVVVHLAARVHVMRETAEDPLAAFRKVNVEGTQQLLLACAKAGVKRFVYVSTIKVNGEVSACGQGFSEADLPNPEDPYSQSKYEAECLVQRFCEAHQMEWVIVRPPLVYGANVQANFRGLLRLLNKKLPLPLGGLNNRRSFIAVTNLAHFLECCIFHPKAANELFVISDGEALALSQVLKLLQQGLAARSWLVPLPGAWLRMLLRLVGRAQVARRLCDELVIDTSKAQRLLHWRPCVAQQEAMRLAAHAFKQAQS